MPADLVLLDRIAAKFNDILEAKMAHLSAVDPNAAELLLAGISDVKATVAQKCPDSDSTRDFANTLFDQYVSTAEISSSLVLEAQNNEVEYTERSEDAVSQDQLKRDLERAQRDLQRAETRTGEFELIAAVDDGTLRGEFMREVRIVFSDLDKAVNEGSDLCSEAEDTEARAHSLFTDDQGKDRVELLSAKLSEHQSRVADVRSRAENLQPKDSAAIELTGSSLIHIEDQLTELENEAALLLRSHQAWADKIEPWRKSQAEARRMVAGIQPFFTRLTINCFELAGTSEERTDAKREQAGRMVLDIEEAGAAALQSIHTQQSRITGIRGRIQALREQLTPLESYLSRPVFDRLPPDEQNIAICLVLSFNSPTESLSSQVLSLILKQHMGDKAPKDITNLLQSLALFRGRGGAEFSLYGLTDCGKHWLRSWRKSRRDLRLEIGLARNAVNEDREAEKEKKRQAKEQRLAEAERRRREREDPGVIFNKLSDTRREVLGLCHAVGQLPTHRNIVEWAKLLSAATLHGLLTTGTAKGKLGSLLSLFKHKPTLFEYDTSSGKKVLQLTELGKRVAAQYPPVSFQALERARALAGASVDQWSLKQRKTHTAYMTVSRDKLLTLSAEHFD